MALPSAMRDTFKPEEIEFLAETLEQVNIMPLYSLEATRTLGVRSFARLQCQTELAQGIIGPWRPTQVATVPLWLAASLKKMRRCKINPPDWLNVANLEEQLKAETTLAAFSSLPLRYMEVAHVLLSCAADEIPDADRIRNLLKDLREARQAKSRLTTEMLDTGDFSVHLDVTGVSVMELNELRPFFSLATKRMMTLDPEEETRRERDENDKELATERAERESSFGGYDMAD